MQLIISHSSMVPIYEQIVQQIKSLILKGSILEGEVLPSVRGLAKELKISALTVKKAYDLLETEGFTVTVHGKGSYVLKANVTLIEEERRKEVEQELLKTIQKGKGYQLKSEELLIMFKLLLEEEE